MINSSAGRETLLGPLGSHVRPSSQGASASGAFSSADTSLLGGDEALAFMPVVLRDVGTSSMTLDGAESTSEVSRRNLRRRGRGGRAELANVRAGRRWRATVRWSYKWTQYPAETAAECCFARCFHTAETSVLNRTNTPERRTTYLDTIRTRSSDNGMQLR